MKRNCVSSHFCLSLNLKDLLDLMADMHFSAAHCGPLAHISKVCWDSKVDSHAVLQILDKIIERNGNSQCFYARARGRCDFNKHNHYYQYSRSHHPDCKD